MSRWQADARGRLVRAALELYDEQGFEAATAAAIAARAGLTERTFFRHFADKREVLFDGSSQMRDIAAREIAAAPADGSPLDAVLAALTAAGAVFVQEREFYCRRMRVIAAHGALRERELAKLATLSAAVADELRRRGVADFASRLAADTGVTVFGVAYERWIAAPRDHDFTVCMREAAAELHKTLDDWTARGRRGR
jgi:AcrR family transcriptional regulator